MLKPDTRFGSSTITTCRKCGCRLVLLPDDKRQGYCFDCYEIINITHTE